MVEFCTRFIFFALLLGTLGLAKELEKYEVCGGKVYGVYADPCEKEPCEIPRGSSAAMTVKCESEYDADKLRLNIYADIAGIELPYPGLKRNACQGKNITCPITKGQRIQYVQKFDVKSFFPKIETNAKFVLVTNDEQDKTVCCVKLPVRVI